MVYILGSGNPDIFSLLTSVFLKCLCFSQQQQQKLQDCSQLKSSFMLAMQTATQRHPLWHSRCRGLFGCLSHLVCTWEKCSPYDCIQHNLDSSMASCSDAYPDGEPIASQQVSYGSVPPQRLSCSFYMLRPIPGTIH